MDAPAAPPPPDSSQLAPTVVKAEPETAPPAPAHTPPEEAPLCPPCDASDSSDDDDGSNGACGVCGLSYSEEDDALLFCDGPGCSVAVHQQCYAVKDLPPDDQPWFCESCAVAAADSQEKGLPPPAGPTQRTCAICEHNNEGASAAVAHLPLAFKRATTMPRAQAQWRASAGADASWLDGWAHVCCATWIDEAQFADETRLIGALVGELSEPRGKLKCELCGKKGQAVQCRRKKCTAAFHPVCALREFVGPKTWAAGYDPEHPGAAFVRVPGASRSAGDVLCGRHCGVANRKKADAPEIVPEKSEYEKERDERIARNQAFLASLGLGGAPVTSAGASGKKKTPKKKRKGMTPSGEPPPARKSPRACAAVQPGRYAVGVTKRSSDEIAEEQDEKAERRLEKLLKRADRAAAAAAADDAKAAAKSKKSSKQRQHSVDTEQERMVKAHKKEMTEKERIYEKGMREARARARQQYKGWGALGPQEGDAVASRKTVEDVLRCSARRAGLPVPGPGDADLCALAAIGVAGSAAARKDPAAIDAAKRMLPACCFCNSAASDADDARGPLIDAVFLAPPTKGRPEGSLLRAHEHCADLSPEVYVDAHGAYHDLIKASRRGQQLKCHTCGHRGATIGCNVTKCTRSYHASCAHASGWRFGAGRTFWCPEHRGKGKEGFLRDRDLADANVSVGRLLGSCSGRWCPRCESYASDERKSFSSAAVLREAGSPQRCKNPHVPFERTIYRRVQQRVSRGAPGARVQRRARLRGALLGGRQVRPEFAGGLRGLRRVRRVVAPGLRGFVGRRSRRHGRDRRGVEVPALRGGAAEAPDGDGVHLQGAGHREPGRVHVILRGVRDLAPSRVRRPRREGGGRARRVGREVDVSALHRRRFGVHLS